MSKHNKERKKTGHSGNSQEPEAKVSPKSSHYTKSGKLKITFYEEELLRLQEEMVKIQYWVKAQNMRVVILFEGRDAAGKGGTIKRITERTNPRVVRVVALGIPSDREKNEWYLLELYELFSYKYIYHLKDPTE